MTKLEQADEIDWIETNKALAKEIIQLKKQVEQSQLADATLEPVARVTGYHGGRCVVEPLNRALVLPIDMALYAAPMKQAEQEPCIECGRPTMSAESKCNDCHSMDDAAPVRTKDLTDDELMNLWVHTIGKNPLMKFARAVIASDREKNK